MAKRRANGEGGIRKRKDGRWEGRYTAGRDPVTGKAIYKNVLGKTQAEVKEKLKAAIEKIGVQSPQTEHYTVGQWLDTWMENYAKLQVRASSHKTYQGFIENHIKPALGDIPLEKLTAMDLQRLYKHLLESGRVESTESRNKPKGLSVKTVRNINQMLSSALNCAVEQHLIPANPTKGCILPKLEKKEMKILPPESLGTFFEEAQRSGVFEVYYIDLATGLRRSPVIFAPRSGTQRARAGSKRRSRKLPASYGSRFGSNRYSKIRLPEKVQKNEQNHGKSTNFRGFGLLAHFRSPRKIWDRGAGAEKRSYILGEGALERN